jgi:lysophospholipase L1-like esterase
MLGCGAGIGPLPALTVPQTDDVVFIGDSITFLWAQEDPAFNAHTNWIDKGINGQTSFQVALRFGDDVVSLYPKTVHILVGTNDVHPGWKSCTAPSYGLLIPGDTCSNVLYMVQTAQHYGIKVVLGAIPPWGCSDNPRCGYAASDESQSKYNQIVELNTFLKAFADKHGVIFVDYHSILQDDTGLHYAKGLTEDGVHPSTQGYEAILPAATAAVQ